MTETQFTDLYKGTSIDIWMDDQDELVTISIHGRVTINLDKEDFQELYNACFISKQVLKDKEDRK